MNKTVLYIEDNVYNMKVTKRFIEHMGYKFVWRMSGLQGIEYAKNFAPDLILLDITLPDLNGFEVASRLRASEKPYLKNVPIIALTGRTSNYDLLKAMEAGFNEYMVKPIDFRALMARVEGILGKEETINTATSHLM